METLAKKKPCVVDGTTTVQSATSVNSTSVDVPKECERDVLLDDVQSTTPNVTNGEWNFLFQYRILHCTFSMLSWKLSSAANSGINDLDGRNSKRRSRESDGSEEPPKKRRSRRNDSTDSEESSATDALKGTIKKLEGEISTLMDKLAVERKKVRAQETELNSMRLRLEAWKKAHAQLSHVAQTEAATPSESPSHYLTDMIKCTALLFVKTNNLFLAEPFEMHESVPGSPDTPILDKFQQFISDGAGMNASSTSTSTKLIALILWTYHFSLGAEHPDGISVTRKALKFDDGMFNEHVSCVAVTDHNSRYVPSYTFYEMSLTLLHYV